MYYIRTSAKVNLGLTVVGKLEDGYHEIETIMVPLGIYDTISVDFSLNNLSKSLNVESDFDIPNDERNIIWKMVNFVERIIKREIGFRIKIKKEIPVGSGLGGGSSNAAGVVRCLLDFLKLQNILSDEIENNIISGIHKVGADVPFFLSNGAKVAQGIGEKLTHLRGLVEKLVDYKVIVVYPGIHVSTEESYRLIDEKGFFDKDGWALYFYKKFMNGEIGIEDFKKMLKNSFESFIIEEVKKIKEFLYSEDAMFALMSGSGSAVYGLFSRDVDFSKLREKLVNRFSVLDKFVYEVRFVNEPFLFFTGGIL